MTLDTDTTVHTLADRWADASYNPKNKATDFPGRDARIPDEWRPAHPPGERFPKKIFRGPIPAFIAGKRWKPTNKRRGAQDQATVEQLQQAECPRPTATLLRNANSSTSRTTRWGRACRFVRRYEKEPETDEVKQYQLFETSAYTYRD